MKNLEGIFPFENRYEEPGRNSATRLLNEVGDWKRAIIEDSSWFDVFLVHSACHINPGNAAFTRDGTESGRKLFELFAYWSRTSLCRSRTSFELGTAIGFAVNGLKNQTETFNSALWRTVKWYKCRECTRDSGQVSSTGLGILRDEINGFWSSFFNRIGHS